MSATYIEHPEVDCALGVHWQLLQEPALAPRAVVLTVLNVERGVTGGGVAVILCTTTHTQTDRGRWDPMDAARLQKPQKARLQR